MTAEEAGQQKRADKRQERQRDRDAVVRGAVEPLSEEDEGECRDRPRELERDERVHPRPPHRDPPARKEPDEQRGRAPEPDVQTSSSPGAPRVRRSWTSASPCSGSRSTTRRFGAREAVSVAQARRPRSMSRWPPAGKGSVRKAPRGGRPRAARTRKKSGTTRRSWRVPRRSQRASTR